LKDNIAEPKLESWEKLETMLEETPVLSYYWIFKIAAVVLFFIGIVLVIFMQSEPNQSEVIAVTSPVEISKDAPRQVMMEPVLEAETSETENVLEEDLVTPRKEAIKLKAKNIRKQKVTPPVAPETKTAVITSDEIDLAKEETLKIPIDNQSTLLSNAAPEFLIVNEPVPVKEERKTIRITYKRGKQKNALIHKEDLLATQRVDTTDQTKLKKLVAQSRDFSPGDLWADIRDAKDGLFQLKLSDINKNSKYSNK
jgi:hypothetical protein